MVVVRNFILRVHDFILHEQGRTALRDFQLVQPFVTALRNNDQRALRVYEDMRSINLSTVGAAHMGTLSTSPLSAATSARTIPEADPSAQHREPPKPQTTSPQKRKDSATCEVCQFCRA